MRLTLKNQELLSGLNKAIGVIDRRSIQTVFAHFLFRAEESKLRLYASDGNMEMHITIKMESLVETAFGFTLPARKLHEICRNIPMSDSVVIELEEKEESSQETKSRVATIRTSSFNYKLQTKDPGSFPLITASEQEEEKTSIWIRETDLKEMLLKTSSSISIIGVDGKPYMRGLTIQTQTDQKISATAIDGLRMSHTERHHIHKTDQDRTFVLPRKGVMEISRITEAKEKSDDKKSELHLRISKTHLSLISPFYTLITKLVDAHTPNHMGVVPNNLNKQFKFDTEHLLTSLRRSMVVLGDRNKLVNLRISKGELTLFAKNSEEESLTETLATDYLEEDREIILNATHLHDLLSTIDSEKTQMCFADERTNVLIKDTDTDGDWHVLAPYVRTESEEEPEEDEEDTRYEEFYGMRED